MERGPAYELRHGSYYLMRGESIVTMTDQVAMAFDRFDDGTAVLMKHGAPADVERWLTEARAKYRAVGQGSTLGMVTLPAGYPVEEINRCLDTSGYIEVLLEKVEAQPTVPPPAGGERG